MYLGSIRISMISSYNNNTWEKHIETIAEVNHRLQAANLTINLSKSDFYQASVEYPGHFVGYGKAAPAIAKTENISRYPRNVRENSFLGHGKFYRKFCEN